MIVLRTSIIIDTSALSCHENLLNVCRCKQLCISKPDVKVKSVEPGDPENMSISVEIAHLSSLEWNIGLFRVWRPPYCISGVG
jgi:hypothetical protein